MRFDMLNNLHQSEWLVNNAMIIDFTYGDSWITAFEICLGHKW